MKFKKHFYIVQLIESDNLVSIRYVTFFANPNHYFDKYISYLAYLDFHKTYPLNMLDFEDCEFIIREI